MLTLMLLKRYFLEEVSLKPLFLEDVGQDLIEYGLLIGIITVACVVSIIVLGPRIAGYYTALLALLP